jgi:hypothetical protein
MEKFSFFWCWQPKSVATNESQTCGDSMRLVKKEGKNSANFGFGETDDKALGNVLTKAMQI